MQPLRITRSLASLGVLVAAAAFGDACTEAPKPPPVDVDGDGVPDDVDVDVPGVLGPELPAPATRFARLTARQWENSVRDLLRLDEATGFSSELAPDAIPAEFLFDNAADSLVVDATQWAGFQRAAQRTAALVTGDPALLARIAPAGIAPRDLILELGARAHRRPLTDVDVAGYEAVFAAGADGFAPADPFVGGVRLLLEAMLQSPYFLYRVEESSDVTGEIIALDGYELASRLSYALWSTMPDDELFDAAAAGLLESPDGVEAQARRMLDDEKAKATMLAFHAQYLEAEKLAGVAPSAAFFPDAPVDLGGLAAQETELFLDDVFATGGGLAEVLTSNKTFVNRDLARVYNVDVDADDFVAVELDPAVRAGLFTQVAFLAQFSTSVDPDPIHRGVYLARHVACLNLTAPPANIPPLPPTEDLQTNRDRVVEHTEQASPCKDCHAGIINPFGFPYEGFDAVGAQRTHDNGLPVDTNAAPLLDDGPTAVSGAVDLAHAFADSAVVHECYSEHWLQFAFGRPRERADDNLITRLGAFSRRGAGLKDLLVEVVTSPAFLARSAVEQE